MQYLNFRPKSTARLPEKGRDGLQQSNYVFMHTHTCGSMNVVRQQSYSTSVYLSRYPSGYQRMLAQMVKKVTSYQVANNLILGHM
eukprot:c19069_g3_i1 orf=247-501(-)